MLIDFNDKKVAILGWGINGFDVYKFISKYNSEITIYDKKTKNELDFSKVDLKRTKFCLGKDYLKDGLLGYDYIFRSPGVYRFLPKIIEAEKEGVIITSAIKLFFDLCPGKIIGVTGTKGKGTTSTLIYRILKKDGFDVYLAGNIGYPVLELLKVVNSNSWVVLELSSFQLIDMRKSPYISVVLNITEDHLDWHKNKKEYVNSKLNIVKFQERECFAVLNYDYETSRRFSKYTKAKVRYFSSKKPVNGVFIERENMILNIANRKEKLVETCDLLLRGKHNWENVQAACCSSYLAGASIKSIKSVIRSFKGLEHRLELIGKVDSISFYNDSSSTNPNTTIAAINSFNEEMTLILGGSDKGLSYDLMSKEIVKRDNIKNIILIGEVSDIILKSLLKIGYKGKIVVLGKASMKDIVKKSLILTPKNGIVLFSPACASFDMFKDYKDRGNQFKVAVKILK